MMAWDGAVRGELALSSPQIVTVLTTVGLGIAGSAPGVAYRTLAVADQFVEAVVRSP
jgi:hypothetical protein